MNRGFLAWTVLAALAPTAAMAQDAAPKLDTGDTAWMLTSTALVLMMTIPGLALFYGGMVRKKNVLATVMQSFAITCLVTVLWMICGYSLAFGKGGPWLGGLQHAFLQGVGSDPNLDYGAWVSTLEHDQVIELANSHLGADAFEGEFSDTFGISVPDVEAACARFESLGVKFVKRPGDGRMKGIAFIQDPDGYWTAIHSGTLGLFVNKDALGGKAYTVVGEASYGIEASRLTAELKPEAQPGNTPNSLALSPDGKHLFIANANTGFRVWVMWMWAR